MIRVKRCRYGDMAYPANDRYVGKSLDGYGEYSEAEVILFRHLVKPGCTVLEIGANIGAHTVPLAQMVGPQGQVHAFEPQRFIYYVLCANVVLNNLGNVICYQAAVGDVSGTIQVPELDYEQEENFGGLDLEARHQRPCYDVPLLRVDDLPLTGCDLIKIDVEGMEKRVLEGAVATIARFKPFLYVEDDRRDRSQELHDFLKTLGYECHWHRPAFHNPENFGHNQVDVFGNLFSANLLCRHQQSSTSFDEHCLSFRAAQEPFARGCNMQGSALLDQGRFDEAAEVFRRAVRWWPQCADAIHNLGLTLLQQGRLEEAAASFQQALEIEPQRDDSFDGLGNAATQLTQQQRLDSAVACYRQMLRFRPQAAIVHNNVGVILAGQGRLAEALASFEEAIRSQHDYADAHNNRAVVQAMLANQ